MESIAPEQPPATRALPAAQSLCPAGCYCCFHLRSRSSIQSFAALCFISNALLLLILFFIVVNPEEATVYIKLSIVHTTLKEVSLLPIPYVITTTLSIMVDLLLLIGIEDNCREVLQVYIGWSSACTAFESVSWIGLVAWKANSENLGFFKTPSIILIGVVLFKVYTVRHLRDYLRVLKDAQPITRAPS
ncbi:uncharacterized protein [Dermacentor andersoni]|uniref:uncharacterized protein isoform X2 n=1 Tax=Dermacentor andersoni TaxID=34620 RepID=UPI002417A396|nr:uncharacterized protein LOC126535870 isoform X2 [Dermacentor andersoni]